MTNIILCFIIIGSLILVGFAFYIFLSKVSKKGKVIIKWKIVISKILQIEFKVEHK